MSTIIQSSAISSKRKIAHLSPDIVFEENHEDTLQITEHPVEQGAVIADHAIIKPKTLTMRGAISASSPKAQNNQGYINDFYNELLELQIKREPIDVITGKRLYKNMLISSLSVISDAQNENVLAFTAEFQEVILVETLVTTMPPRSRQAQANKTASPTDSGQKQAQPTSRSMLSNLRVK